MLILSSQPEGNDVEKGNPLVNQAFQLKKIEGALKAARGMLPALVTLSETITDNISEIRCNIDGILATLLIIARKASASSVSEATLSLTVLLRALFVNEVDR